MPIFRLFPKKIIPILMLGFFILGCSLFHRSEENPTLIIPYSFEKHTIELGTEERQTVLTGFLTGENNAELIVLYITEDNYRNMIIYTSNEGIWEKKYQTTLRPKVMFVDLVTMGERDLLITYERNQLNWFDFDTMVERPLMDVSFDFKPDNEKVIYHIDITHDINGDDKDDIVIPNYDGFWIATQSDNGSFNKPMKLGSVEPYLDRKALGDNRKYRDIGITPLTIHWYLSRIHQMDYNRDNRPDLVFWTSDHFDVYYQDTDGLFSPTPDSFRTIVPFDADSAYSIAFDSSGENMFALIFGFRKKLKRRVLYTFKDINNDNVSDMVIHSLEGRSLGNQKSFYHIHYGKPVLNGTKFTKRADTTIFPHGTAGALLPWGYSSQWIQDFDGDGDIDILFKDVHTAITGMTRAMIGNSIPIDLEFYRMDDISYPQKPNKRIKIRPKMNIFDDKRVYFPAILFGDVNGDKYLDLIVGKDWNEMHIFLGRSETSIISKKPEKIMVRMPNDERNVRLVDMNRDNKKDILIYNPSSTKPHQVTMLTSK